MSGAIATMGRTRWTKPRIARMCFLIGRGLKAEDVADDPLVGSYASTVHTVANSLGLAFNDVPRGTLRIDLPRPLLIALQEQAKRRQQTAEALASMAVRILAGDPVLLDNVLDDEG